LVAILAAMALGSMFSRKRIDEQEKAAPRKFVLPTAWNI
jgi:hypothetical protein